MVSSVATNDTCVADGMCAAHADTNCCSKTAHYTLKCHVPKLRCGCLADGECVEEDASLACCSKKSHLTAACSFSQRRCGAAMAVAKSTHVMPQSQASQSKRQASCTADGECVDFAAQTSSCCSHSAHFTAACESTPGTPYGSWQRCGCLPDGQCLNIGDKTEFACCSKSSHSTGACGGHRRCGSDVGDNITVVV